MIKVFLKSILLITFSWALLAGVAFGKSDTRILTIRFDGGKSEFVQKKWRMKVVGLQKKEVKIYDSKRFKSKLKLKIPSTIKNVRVDIETDITEKKISYPIQYKNSQKEIELVIRRNQNRKSKNIFLFTKLNVLRLKVNSIYVGSNLLKRFWEQRKVKVIIKDETYLKKKRILFRGTGSQLKNIAVVAVVFG